MSVFDKHRDALEVHETMMGRPRGWLAVALDLLTDSLALVGQHGVYCRSERFPGQPKMDVALILETLNGTGHVVLAVLAAGYFPGVGTAPLLLACSAWLGTALLRKGPARGFADAHEAQ